jgi:hypothetical protein
MGEVEFKHRDLRGDRGYRVVVIDGGRRGELSVVESKPAPFKG